MNNLTFQDIKLAPAFIINYQAWSLWICENEVSTYLPYKFVETIVPTNLSQQTIFYNSAYITQWRL